MRKSKQEEINTLPMADNKRWLRIDKKAEQATLHKHTTDIYKKISTLKIQKEKLDFSTFDGSYEEFSRIIRRLDLEISRYEQELVQDEDMLMLYEREIPISADDFNECRTVNRNQDTQEEIE